MPESRDPAVGHLLRELAPQVLAALACRHGDFAAAEDAVQEALIAAATQWPADGVPRNPHSWLYRVAVRRLTNHLRSELARRRREDAVASEVWAEWAFVPPAHGGGARREAIRLTRALHRLLPEDGEVTGLLALMLLTDARRAARTGPNGELIPLDEQDRTLWDPRLIAEGVALVSDALSRGSIGAYQIQATIAAVHDEAARAEDTDWPRILALYGLLERLSDSPMGTLNRAIAAAMVHGPEVGLGLLTALDDDPRLPGHYRLDAVRAHLLERAGDRERAVAHHRAAAERTKSIPERNYLMVKAARLGARRSDA